MDTRSDKERILALKKENDAIILAHNYQEGPVQDVADLVGDSLELARAAALMEGRLIVFCGVDFMAETAAILSPSKTVVLPAGDACCPMAQMVTPEEIRSARTLFPSAAVVSYVNTSAGVKAESDICCTSANAVKVVNSLDEDQVLFVPDRNLAHYVSRHSEKEIIPWEGSCYVHDRMTRDDVASARTQHPAARIIVHPECRPEVIEAADFVESTSGMIRRVRDEPAEEFVIGTEIGILYRLEEECPGKRCYPLSGSAVCVNMKKTSLSLVENALLTRGPKVTVPEPVAGRARKAITRMLEIR